jgi:hypothetical protein
VEIIEDRCNSQYCTSKLTTKQKVSKQLQKWERNKMGHFTYTGKEVKYITRLHKESKLGIAYKIDTMGKILNTK